MKTNIKISNALGGLMAGLLLLAAAPLTTDAAEIAAWGYDANGEVSGAPTETAFTAIAGGYVSGYALRPPNTAPTADAGLDQSIHAGNTVQLDGRASFDDNTDSQNLEYAWSFTEQPAGSAATLSGADTATPSLVADLDGNYVVQLIVTDEGDLASDPDEVLIISLVLTKDQCKGGGWQSLFRSDGTPFKNQGDCIQYVNTGK